MSNRNLVLLTVKISREHLAKLDDVAAHDKTSRSQLVRTAIARLLNGRKATLYGMPKCNEAHVDRFGQTQPCFRKHDVPSKETDQ